jgi:kinesin family protein 18/19
MPKSKTSNILVAVRVRDGVVGPKTLKVMDEKLIVASDPMEAHKKNVLRTKRTREKQYAFDYAFGPEVKSTKVYESTTRHLIDGVLDGYNATVFAYGATGSGKTFTMLGTDTEPGIMVFTLRDLFSRCRNVENDPSSGVKYTISISYLEVYNELIRDLLTPANEFLDLREDPTKGPTVAGLSEVSTKSTDEVMRLLQKGNKRRTQEATAANAESSRSHAVLQVSIERRESAPGVDKVQVQVGKLSMIDLAGSERASVTKNRGQRLIEGANINRSLLALGNCINALAKKGSKGSYIPYRDSKLTRLLKDSLGGSCRTVMITCVSPASRTFEETINSLKYANRAKNIKTNVKRNVLNLWIKRRNL